LLALIWFFVANASENMVKAGIASGFDFLWQVSGIDVPFTIIEYSPKSDIFRLLQVGIANTLLVSALGMVFATLLGFVVGVARLSRNWLLANFAAAYVEFIRNIPLLLFVFFWYFGVVRALPPPRASLDLGGWLFLNNRGLYVPTPQNSSVFWIAALASVGAALFFVGLRVRARRRQADTGQPFPVVAAGAALLLGVPAVAFGLAGVATSWDVPGLRGFNFRDRKSVV